MSYQIEVILTDGRKVRRVYGSKDLSYLSVIDEQDYDEYDFFLESYFDLSTGELSSKKLMKNCIEGNTGFEYEHLMLNPENKKFAKSTLGAVYGYLHQKICWYFGKVINRNEDRSPMLKSYLDEFENRNRAFFKIPYSSDFPHIFCVLYEERETYKKRYSEKLHKLYPDNGELQKDIAFIFNQMEAGKTDVLLCNY